jgi:hypothetical protein
MTGQIFSNMEANMRRFGRFEHRSPGLLKSVGCAIRYPRDWRNRLRIKLIDHETSEVFTLDDDEEGLIDRLAEVINAANSLDLRANKVLIDYALDRVALSIKSRREGNCDEWDRFIRMTPEAWIAWYRSLLSSESYAH